MPNPKEVLEDLRIEKILAQLTVLENFQTLATKIKYDVDHMIKAINKIKEALKDEIN